MQRLSNALLTRDRYAPALYRSQVSALLKLLNSTCNKCSTRNLQRCRDAILIHILPSSTRTTALLKYLVSLGKAWEPRAKDYTPRPEELEGLSADAVPPSSAYKRLHILCILDSVLTSITGLRGSSQAPPAYQHLNLANVIVDLKRYGLSLFKLAACRGVMTADQVSDQLKQLATKWQELKIFDKDEIERIAATAKTVQDRDWNRTLTEIALDEQQRLTEEKKAEAEAYKWVLPVRHGVKDDPEAPWWELPAANGLYMKSTRGFPIRAAAFPRGGYEVTNGGREADPDLKHEVTSLHKELLHCFDDFTNPDEVQDIDALGNKVWKDPERPTRNYWGFTYDGVEKARENSRKFRETATGYNGVPMLPPDLNPFDEVDGAVQRARALAASRGTGCGFDRGGGRGRGAGGSGGRGGQWRGPPRGNGYRGGGRGAYQARPY
ncbi:uncharacterized protein CLAFUR5_07372 [Fulvia fulva]|uniref:CID domain-containing protein n=1 Tax=Passalora fulva TaxID=5499 RepID=A0A9Q8PAB8_PASFU|nr:uncharacterized protein CLAFUR5_07372 [Fulvia fulva]KAK4623047.1 hypothetical protein CLAFUR0_07245 [Fulvia fulva]UJO18815.1 hypothetical protein CLAFUR5_07372 [Fulvia fulva]WPV31462.1 hypothetical protein CLAFUW7_07241 [Fulvia fulva]